MSLGKLQLLWILATLQLGKKWDASGANFLDKLVRLNVIHQAHSLCGFMHIEGFQHFRLKRGADQILHLFPLRQLILPRQLIPLRQSLPLRLQHLRLQ